MNLAFCFAKLRTVLALLTATLLGLTVRFLIDSHDDGNRCRADGTA